jgi:nitroimidazol reductase NimA-like FMN-containing flavoprotein (pyridoxamine 5'-phosphate oxidase superfamily)
MNVQLTGPWSMERVREHLERTAIPIRLGCTTTSGDPLVLSLWYAYRDGALWCATQPDAAVTRHLRRNPRCAFEIARDEPPYRGVRGRGTASIVPEQGGEVLRQLLERYQGGIDTPLARWLLSRADREIALRIQPERLATWDFTERMQSGS